LVREVSHVRAGNFSVTQNEVVLVGPQLVQRHFREQFAGTLLVELLLLSQLYALDGFLVVDETGSVSDHLVIV